MNQTVVCSQLHRMFLLRSTESTILKRSRIFFSVWEMRLGRFPRIDMILMCCFCRVEMCEFAQWCAWRALLVHSFGPSTSGVAKVSCKDVTLIFSTLSEAFSWGLCGNDGWLKLVNFEFHSWNLLPYSCKYVISTSECCCDDTNTTVEPKASKNRDTHYAYFEHSLSLPFRICGRSKMRTNLRCWER